MCYSTVIVHLDFDGQADTRLRFAADLAGDLDCFLIGFSAVCSGKQDAVEMGLVADIGDHENLRAKEQMRLGDLRRTFFAIAGDGPNSSWRQEEGIPTDALLRNTRAADLVIAGTGAATAAFDRYRTIDVAELVCRAGRPVLFVGKDGCFRHPETAMIAWKDTPESRRAVCFALPFLRLARHVIVTTVVENTGPEPYDSLKDVVRYLVRHDIDAESMIIEDGNGPRALLAAVENIGADLLVMGAYGHGRVRERVFGGFTRSVLEHHNLTRLMAG